MSPADVIVAVIGVAGFMAVLVYAVRAPRPERLTSSSEGRSDRTADRLYGPPNDRPAGPDAEPA